jgi:hypothetical protein
MVSEQSKHILSLEPPAREVRYGRQRSDAEVPNVIVVLRFLSLVYTSHKLWRGLAFSKSTARAARLLSLYSD